MSGTQPVTLKPGDLVRWEPDPEEENVEASLLMVADNGTDLLFQFGAKPWSDMDFAGHNGLTASEAELVLNGHVELTKFGLSGRVWKAYDAATDRPLIDPAMRDLP